MKDQALWSLLVRSTGAEGLTEVEREQLGGRLAGDPEVARLARAVERMTAASAARAGGEAEPADAPASTSAALARVHERMHRPPRVLRLHRAVAPSRPRRSRAWMGLAAGIVATVAGGTALWRAQSTQQPAVVVLAERVTRAGERTELRLADGSHVVLGPETRLRYPERFDGPDRVVELEGEGYFTVAPDHEHPFIVRSGDATTRAVGTAFSVRAYAGEGEVAVVVTEGRVLMRAVSPAASASASAPASDSVPGTLLDAGERGVMDDSGRVAVEPGVDVARATAWTRGRLAYQGAPVHDVVRDMERWYDLEIAITDSTVARDRVTVTFDHALADDALRRLATVLGARVERDGRSVRLALP